MPHPANDGGEAGSWARQLATLGHVGMMFPVSTGLGLLLGYWADGALDTRPWLMLLGLGLGIAAAVRNLVRSASRFQQEEDRADASAAAQARAAADATLRDRIDLDSDSGTVPSAGDHGPGGREDR